MIPGAGSRRGSSRLGCLVTLALFAGALYYGMHIGEVYFRYFELLDEMRSQARLAPGLTDDAIHRRLMDRADHVVPGRIRGFEVKRSDRPASITITTEYSERVQLPFFDHVFLFRPRAHQPL